MELSPGCPAKKGVSKSHTQSPKPSSQPHYIEVPKKRVRKEETLSQFQKPQFRNELFDLDVESIYFEVSMHSFFNLVHIMID